MKRSFKAGCSFGLTSGAITTTGLIVGLYAGTQSLNVVIGGILTIAIADSLSDALGMHLHEESENVHSHKEIWEAMIATFVSKLFFSLSFLIPIFLFSLKSAVIVCIFWGLNMVAFLSYKIAKEQGKKPFIVMAEHLLIAVIVIIATNFVGKTIAMIYK